MSKILGLILIFIGFNIYAQDCESQLQLQLNNYQGGVFEGETVELTNVKTGTKHELISNAEGIVLFTLPCEQKYDVKISNYTRPLQLESAPYDGSVREQSIGYSPSMAETDKFFQMNDAEKLALDQSINLLPDTSFVKRSNMIPPTDIQNYYKLTMTLVDLKNGPLINEEVVFTGQKRNKSIKGSTNPYGQLIIYLPKGDKYDIHFKHNMNYDEFDVQYTKGIARGNLELMYIGTVEIEKRIAEEKERIRLEEERLAAEREVFLKWCKTLGLTEEEGHMRKLTETYGKDTVVLAVLNRNNWSEKLIVCDLTGSMNPYANQLSVWYQLNYKKEPNLQFVFFNDGNNMADDMKKIGSTGGVYYQESKGLDSLNTFMSMVRANGYGGDCPENNMEALIKGVDMAKPYKELVMIVDNNAPVKDIELLKSFDRPVHIILCGAEHGVLIDYLLIAWKTGGSIHTIEDDITSIASMMEGEEVEVLDVKYRIMGGVFVRISED